jgi:3'-phosphoadenosine 5'-phosphosulfate sulfotransferase (PAPS reductase)/FAD synthetase
MNFSTFWYYPAQPNCPARHHDQLDIAAPPIRSLPIAEHPHYIHASGVPYHYAYDLGFPRVSCTFCVLAGEAALIRGAQLFPDRAARRLAAERRMAARRIVVTVAVMLIVRQRGWPGDSVVHWLRRFWRSGHKFQPSRSMASTIAKAKALPSTGHIEDWAA